MVRLWMSSTEVYGPNVANAVLLSLRQEVKEHGGGAVADACSHGWKIRRLLAMDDICIPVQDWRLPASDVRNVLIGLGVITGKFRRANLIHVSMFP